MASVYTPHQAEAAISKQSVLMQLESHYRQAGHCIPVLWKRFVLPVLQAKWEHKPFPQIHCSEQTLDIDLQIVVTEATERKHVMQLLRRYDYIRFNTDSGYTAGTRLWTEVDARRMLHTVKKISREPT